MRGSAASGHQSRPWWFSMRARYSRRNCWSRDGPGGEPRSTPAAPTSSVSILIQQQRVSGEGIPLGFRRATWPVGGGGGGEIPGRGLSVVEAREGGEPSGIKPFSWASGQVQLSPEWQEPPARQERVRLAPCAAPSKTGTTPATADDSSPGPSTWGLWRRSPSQADHVKSKFHKVPPQHRIDEFNSRGSRSPLRKQVSTRIGAGGMVALSGRWRRTESGMIAARFGNAPVVFDRLNSLHAGQDYVSALFTEYLVALKHVLRLAEKSLYKCSYPAWHNARQMHAIRVVLKLVRRSNHAFGTCQCQRAVNPGNACRMIGAQIV